MDPIVTGSLIGAGGSLLGGLMQGNEAKKLWKKQYRAQKEFAQNTVRWRAADARSAGISPLAAMGVSTSSPSFSITGSGLGDSVASAAGQIGGAIGQKGALARQEARAERALQSEINRNDAAALRDRADASFIEGQAFQSQVKQLAQTLLARPGVLAVPQGKPSLTPEEHKRRSEMAAPDKIGGVVSGMHWQSSGRYSPAEWWEQNYGEAGGLLGGLLALLDDIQYNTGGRLYRGARDYFRKHGIKRPQSSPVPFPDRSKF